jgi:hypothetical protein
VIREARGSAIALRAGLQIGLFLLLAAIAPAATADDGPSQVVVRVTAASEAGGTASPASEALPGARAAAVRVAPGGEVDVDAVLGGSGAVAADGDTTLSIPGGPGLAAVIAVAPGRAPSLVVIDDSAASPGRVDIPLRDAAMLEVRVRTAVPPEDGAPPRMLLTEDLRPVEGARVRIRSSAGSGPEAIVLMRESLTGATGRTLFTDVARGKGVSAEVRAPGFARRFLPLLFAGGATAEIRMERGATVVGQVVGVPGGEPMAGVRIEFQGEVVLTAADGMFQVADLVAAPGLLRAGSEGFGDEVVPVNGLEPGGRIDLGVIRLVRPATVRTRVVDAQGRPVAGVRVQFLRAPGQTERPVIDPPPAVTDADGCATLGAVPAGVGHRLLARPVHPLARSLSLPFAVLPGETLDVVLPPVATGGQVEVRVVDVDGLPLSGASVRLVEAIPGGFRRTAGEARPGDLGDTVLSDAQGRAVFLGVPVGQWWVAASLHGRLDTAREVFTLKAGDAVRRWISLDRAFALRGVVLGLDDSPEAGLTLGLRDDGATYREVRTDSRGSFTVFTLAPGPWRVFIASRKRIPPGAVSAWTVEVPADGVQLRMGSYRTVRGRVEDDAGEPVEGVRLSAVVLPLEPSTSNRESVTRLEGPRTTETGIFEMVVPTTVAVRLQAAAPDGRFAVTALQPGELEEPVRIILQHVPIVRGRVVEKATGQPRADGRVRLLAGEFEETGLVAETDADGVFLLAGAPPGLHAVEVSAPGCAPAVVGQVLVPRGRGIVELGDLSLEAGVDLLLRVLDLQRLQVQGLTIHFQGAEGGPVSAVTNSVGEVRFPGVAPGDAVVELAFVHGSTLRLPLRVPETGSHTEEIDLGRGGTTSLVVQREDGPVSGVRVRILADAGVAEGVTDGSGRFQLPLPLEGRALAMLAPPGEPEVPMVVHLLPGELLVMLPSSRLDGTVTDERTGRPVPWATVRLVPLRVPDLLRMDGTSHDAVEVVAFADIQGKVSFPALPKGRWLPDVYATGFALLRGQPVEVTPSGGTAEAHWILAEEAVVSGLVRGVEGRLERAEVVALDGTDTGARVLGRAFTDSDGRFELTGLAAGSVLVQARFPGQGSSAPEAIALAPGDKRKVTLELDPGGNLSVLIVGPGAIPLSGVEVEVMDFFGHPVAADPSLSRTSILSRANGTTGPDGTVVYRSLRAGTYIVRARFENWPEEESRVRVDAESGGRAVLVLDPVQEEPVPEEPPPGEPPPVEEPAEDEEE